MGKRIESVAPKSPMATDNSFEGVPDAFKLGKVLAAQGTRRTLGRNALKEEGRKRKKRKLKLTDFSRICGLLDD